MAFSIKGGDVDTSNPLIPFRRDLTDFERWGWFRLLVSDAVVGLQAHAIVFLSSEPKIRVAAKLGYSLFLTALVFTGPTALAKIARTEDGAQILKAEVLDQNVYVFAAAALLNFVGAALLMTAANNDNNKSSKAKSS